MLTLSIEPYSRNLDLLVVIAEKTIEGGDRVVGVERRHHYGVHLLPSPHEDDLHQKPPLFVWHTSSFRSLTVP